MKKNNKKTTISVCALIEIGDPMLVIHETQTAQHQIFCSALYFVCTFKTTGEIKNIKRKKNNWQ